MPPGCFPRPYFKMSTPWSSTGLPEPVDTSSPPDTASGPCRDAGLSCTAAGDPGAAVLVGAGGVEEAESTDTGGPAAPGGTVAPGMLPAAASVLAVGLSDVSLEVAVAGRARTRARLPS